MALAIANEEVYEILSNKDLKFKETISDRLKCVLCKSILKNAKQTECGCKGCEKCFKNYLEKGEKVCPSKQSDCEGIMLQMNSINADNATNKEILRLKAYCPFKCCSVCLTIRELNDHLSDCRYRLIPCTECGEEYQYHLASNHQSEHCSKRTVLCQFCQLKIKYDKMIKIHLDADSEELCREYFTICPNNCDVKEKVNLKEHLRNCENQKIQCPYHNFDCEAGKMTMKELVEHMETEANKHVEFLVNTVKEMIKELEKYKEQYEHVSNLLKETLETNKKQTQAFLKMAAEFSAIKSRPTVSAAPMTFGDRAVIHRNGSYIWKVTEFSNKKIDAESGGRVSFTSDPFYTSEFGYKMCLKIYPAGDRIGRGTHLSVFFAIMKGEFDDLLSWPIKKRVTLSVLGQKGNQQHHSDACTPDDSACQESNGDECNIISGFSKFINLSDLEMPTNPYYHNDTIFIKITIDDNEF